MDVRPLEAVLTEVGKAFRLCRFYPATHPSVQQSLAALAGALPALARVGPAELRIGTSGFLMGGSPIAAKNPQLQEMAGILYAQGNRTLHLEPGLTADEVATFIRAIGSGTERAMQAVGGRASYELLPHIRLGRTAHRSLAATPSPATPGASQEARTTGAFRPDAMPADMETRRLTASLERGGPEAGTQIARLTALLPELADRRDYRTIAPALRVLGRYAHGTDPGLAASARLILEAGVTPAVVTGLVLSVIDAALPAEERDIAVQALGALGARAIPSVADAYLGASEEGREMLAAVVRRAGAAGAAPLLDRANPEAEPDLARAWARLLAATGSPEAAMMLGAFAQHEDPTVRVAAVEGLMRIQDPEAVRVALTALRDGEPAVRSAAARGFAWLGDPSLVPILIARLQEEEHDEVMIALIASVGELRDSRAVDVLDAIADGVSGVFQRHPAPVRAAAIRALGVIGTDEARDIVAGYREHRVREIRLAAQAALK
jgi:HEAT repeat protein/PBS lyase HEAT-like repeat-containing protein